MPTVTKVKRMGVRAFAAESWTKGDFGADIAASEVSMAISDWLVANPGVKILATETRATTHTRPNDHEGRTFYVLSVTITYEYEVDVENAESENGG